MFGKSREGLKKVWTLGKWISKRNSEDLAGGLEDSECVMVPSHTAEVFSARLFGSTGDPVSCTDHHLNGV